MFVIEKAMTCFVTSGPVLWSACFLEAAAFDYPATKEFASRVPGIGLTCASNSRHTEEPPEGALLARPSRHGIFAHTEHPGKHHGGAFAIFGCYGRPGTASFRSAPHLGSQQRFRPLLLLLLLPLSMDLVILRDLRT